MHIDELLCLVPLSEYIQTSYFNKLTDLKNKLCILKYNKDSFL